MATEVLTNVVAVIVVLGIMILVHEWGHFMVAKLFGVRVEIFSFGFGPRLWGRRHGPTDYRLSALPLGGYVKMAGDNPAEERSGAADEFLSKPRWQRALIAIAGPAMNIVTAVILLAGTFIAVGLPYPAYLSRPVEVVAFPKNSLGPAADIHLGDRLVDIDGIANPTWEQVQTHLGQATPGTEIKLELRRGDELVHVSMTPPDPQDVDAILGYPPVAAVIDQVAPGMPAERGGMRDGDEVVQCNGQPVVTWPQLVETIRHSNGQPVQMLVRRGDRRILLQIRPVLGQTLRGEQVWQIGAAPRPEAVYRRLGPAAAVQQGLMASVAVGRQIYGIVGKLFVGKVSLRQLQSVIGIARESGHAVRRGPVALIELMAMISLNLAILNLLPIPILDGGHVLLLLVEGGLRRDLSVALKERFVQVGLVFLLVIIAIVMYNDVLRLLPNR